MITQLPRSFTRLAAAIVIAAVIVSATLLGSSAFHSTVTSTSTIMVLGGTTYSTQTVSCTALDTNGGILLQVTDGTVPVAGANVTWNFIGNCNGATSVVAGYGSATTNSTGWTSMCSEDTGICLLSVRALGFDYPLSVPLQGNFVTLQVHFDLASGNVSVTSCSNSQTCQ